MANFRTFWDMMIGKLSDQLFYDNYMDEEPRTLRCDGVNPYCQDPNPLYCPQMEITVTMPKCQDLCVYEDPNNGQYRFEFKNCITSESACCVWKNFYCACVNAQGEFIDIRVVRQSEPIVYPVQTEEGCGNDSQQSPPCPEVTGFIFKEQIQCYQHCGSQP